MPKNYKLRYDICMFTVHGLFPLIMPFMGKAKDESGWTMCSVREMRPGLGPVHISHGVVITVIIQRMLV